MNKIGEKIVIFGHQVLTQRLMDELCLDDLAKVFNVEYWNCNALCVPHVELMKNQIERPWVYEVKDIKTLKGRLNDLPPHTIGVLKIFVNADMYQIHKIIGPKVSCGILYYLNKGIWDCMLGTFHTKEDDKPAPNITVHSTTPNILRRLKALLYRNEKILLLGKFIKYGGGKEYQAYRNNYKIQKMLSYYPHVYYMGVDPNYDFVTSHPDFDKILKLGDVNKEAKPYIVFIDAFYPYHADWKERNPLFDWNAVAEPYYKSMRDFFDKVEEQYKCEVIIAAHPNANYENNPYGRRECIKYKTVELVKDCKAVILHSSNSINFIAYYNKPVCFVSNAAIKAGDFQYCLYQMASSLSKAVGLALYDIDHMDHVENIFKSITEDVRNVIIQRYFGDTSKGLPNAEILKEHFSTIFKTIE